MAGVAIDWTCYTVYDMLFPLLHHGANAAVLSRKEEPVSAVQNVCQQCRMRSERRKMSYLSHHFRITRLNSIYLFIYMIEHRSVRSLMTFSVLLFVCRWLEGWSYVSHRYLEKNRARRSVNKFYRVLPTGKVGEDSNCRFQSTGPAGSACLTLVNGSFSGDFVMCDFTVGSI
jgi:hypothetical protein